MKKIELNHQLSNIKELLKERFQTELIRLCMNKLWNIKSLCFFAYVAADAGYDVWMPNWRGSFYSRNHTTKSPIDPSFWEFSFHDIGLKDYPAVIKYVQNQTNSSKVYVIAHSQGTSAMMAMLSELPEMNEKIAAFSLLAPVSYLNNSDYLYRLLGAVGPLFEVVKDTEFLPRSSVIQAGSFCAEDLTHFCDNFLKLLYGPSDDQKNSVREKLFHFFLLRNLFVLVNSLLISINFSQWWVH